jgi:hypothetical protein
MLSREKKEVELMRTKRTLTILGTLAIVGLVTGCGSNGSDTVFNPPVAIPTTPLPPAAAPANSTSTVTASPSSGIVANGTASSTITVTLRDINQIPVAGQAVSLSSTGSGNIVTPSSGATNSAGVFTATLASTTAETKTVTATVNPGATQLVLTQQPTVTFDPTAPGSPDPNQSVVTASPLNNITANGADQSAIVVTVRDSGGLLLQSQAVQLNSGTGTLFAPSSGMTDVNGVFNSVLTSTQAGTKTVTATVDPSGTNVVISTMPAVVFGAPAGTPDPAQSTFTATPPTGVSANGIDNSTLTVTVRDPQGNVLSGQAVSLSLTGTQATIAQSTGTTNGSGVFNATISATAAGIKTITAVINPGANQITLNTMATVSFVPFIPASAAQSTVSATPIMGIFANGLQTSAITVTVRDVNGNLLATRPVTISASGTNNTITPTMGVTNASGVLSATISTTDAGAKVISATTDTNVTPILISQTATVTFDVLPPGPNANLSTLTAIPNTGIVANGTGTSAITVTVVDAAGTLLANQTVQMSATGTLNTFNPASGTTNASGVFTSSLTSTDPGTKTLTATINPAGTPIVLTAMPMVTFDPVPLGAPDPNLSTFTATPIGGILNNGTDISTLTLTVRDANSALLVGTSVSLSATGGGVTFANATGVTNASGVFTTTITSTTFGAKVITAVMDPAGANVTAATMPTVTFDNIFTVTTGTAGNDTLTGTGVRDQIDGLDGDDILDGAGGDDLLNGGNGNDTLTGGAGADQINGDAGIDTASYSGSAAGVTVSLSTGVGTGGDAQGDVLTGIENLVGSPNNDTLSGDAMDNILDGGAGDDIIGGGAGADTLIGGPGADALDGRTNPVGMPDFASYVNSPAAVTIDLGANTASGGDAAGDSFAGIGGLNGSPFDDSLMGDANANTLLGNAGADRIDGGDGDDLIEGGAGADALEGGIGNDTASYRNAPAPITEIVVDLIAGVGAESDAEGDTLNGIENVMGSDFNDLLIGNGNRNILMGFAGSDRLAPSVTFGLAGNAAMSGGAGIDLLFLFGNDVAMADGGTEDDAAILHVDTDLSNAALNTAIGGMEEFFVTSSPGLLAPITITVNATDIIGLGGVSGTISGNPRTFIFITAEPSSANSINSIVQGKGWTFSFATGAIGPIVVGRTTSAAYNVYENAALGVGLIVDLEMLNQNGIVP